MDSGPKSESSQAGNGTPTRRSKVGRAARSGDDMQAPLAKSTEKRRKKRDENPPSPVETAAMLENALLCLGQVCDEKPSVFAAPSLGGKFVIVLPEGAMVCPVCGHWRILDEYLKLEGLCSVCRDIGRSRIPDIRKASLAGEGDHG